MKLGRVSVQRTEDRLCYCTRGLRLRVPEYSDNAGAVHLSVMENMTHVT